MADKLLRSIKFPTLPDRYVIGDTSLSEEGAAAEAKAVGEALATKADTKGTYEDLIVGGAEQLMADGCESDSDPYLFRPTGGSADVGNREYLDKIVGGSVAWNQFIPVPNIDTTTMNGVTCTNNLDGTVTFNGTATEDTQFIVSTGGGTSANPSHKYLLCGCPSNGSISTFYQYDGYSHVDAGKGYVGTLNLLRSYFLIRDGVTVTNLVLEPQLFDLTQMFGSTIADYIYNLEQSQAGAGVAWFRNYFPKDYYPYDPGTLRSVEGVSAHETVGFNQWDEELEAGQYSPTDGKTGVSGNAIRAKNYIPVLENTEYYVYMTSTTSGRSFFYDADYNLVSTNGAFNRGIFTVPSGARYMKFHTSTNYGKTYNNDICINLSDPSRNGEYEPYTKHTYPLDSSLTLRGVPKLVDGKLAFDGDVYPPSGEVQRRYGLRAYQSGDESLADAITDGANTVYKLATPTTETADGYEQYQRCDPSGTEEFVTTGIVPVGHETRYPHDLKKKIETAPDSPSTDGTYMMKRSGGKNTYMALPSTPSANGAYVLTVTVSGGTASYSWTAKE